MELSRVIYHQPMLGLLLLLPSIVAIPQSATAPATAEVAGTVVDRWGGAIPGVTVMLEATGVALQRAVTNPTGAYRLDNVAPGTYTVTFHLAGFQTHTRPRLVLAPGQSHTMNIIQGGINPARRSEGLPAIPLERTTETGIRHVAGVVSMARGTAADTATSDFFVLLDDQPSLDFGGQRFEDGQGGAAFGRVVEGLDVVRRIQQQPVEGQNLSAPVTIWRVWRIGGE